MAEADLSQLGGLTGWVASVIESLGEVGVGLLVALENLIPPIPSEIVLSMAGFLANQGRVNLVLVWVAATAGSVLGAVALYWLGRALGEERLKRWLDHIPLVDSDDLHTADRWFERHAKSAVLVGRCAPVVRSLISIPAGTSRMPMGMFLLFTILGSAIWNVVLAGAGLALGENWDQILGFVRQYERVILVALAVAMAVFFARRLVASRTAAAAGKSGPSL